jgi:hypothetical protein
VRKRADRVYIDDLLNITYANDGRLVSVRFGDGNVWVFSYGQDGMQFVQDRYGTSVARTVATGGVRSVVQRADRDRALSQIVQRLESLLIALNASG